MVRLRSSIGSHPVGGGFMITIRATSPGIWSVYQSRGLHTNVKVGRIIRNPLDTDFAAFHDKKGRVHSLPLTTASWANKIRKLLGE